MKSRIQQNSISGIAPAFFVSGRIGSILFTVLASILLLLALLRPQAVSGLRVVTTDVMTPVLSFFTRPFQNMAEAVGSVSGVAALRAENTQLKTENARLKEWYQTALMLQAENQSLQELLNLKVDTTHHYVTARVISDAGNAFVKTVLVSSGEPEGIKKNQAVLAGEGMIGRVIETGQKSSRVLLLTDINSRVPVMVEGSNQKAILYGNNTDYAVLKHLPNDAGMVENARVITSGDGGVFPSGLPIGRIVKGKDDNMIVKLYADMNKVTYIRILDSKSNKNLIQHQSDF